MDDRFLKDARRAPRPEFAEALRARLNRQDAAERDGEPRRRFAWAPALAGAVVVAVAVSLIAFPSVRASAEAFLDLFRVRNFAAVSIDPERLKQLDNGTIDLKGLLSDKVETLEEPGPERIVGSPEEASTAAGISVRVPSEVPRGFTRDTIAVKGPGAARLTVNGAKLRDILDALDIRDVTVPAGLDGARIELRMPAAVGMRYQDGARTVRFLQAHSPEMTLPPGVDLAQLGEVGLRIAGLDPAEAKRFARSIDWHSTLLVPVPSDASSFNEVSVRGNKGLLVTTSGEKTGTGAFRRGASVLMWAEGDMVYAICGSLNRVDIVQMANSVQ
jgi:hypothetical protein